MKEYQSAPYLELEDYKAPKGINSVFIPMKDNKKLRLIYWINLIDDNKGIMEEYSNRSRQIILDSDNPYDSQGRYNIVGVDPDDGLFVRNKDGQSSYQWNLGFKYQF